MMFVAGREPCCFVLQLADYEARAPPFNTTTIRNRYKKREATWKWVPVEGVETGVFRRFIRLRRNLWANLPAVPAAQPLQAGRKGFTTE